MACGSGCCGSPSEPPPVKDSCSVELPEQEDPCCDGHVPDGNAEELDIIDDCGKLNNDHSSSNEDDDQSCQDSCCGDSEDELQDESACQNMDKAANLEDDCCAPQPSCNKGCCSNEEKPCPDDKPAPDCCEGKISPCCDQTCLDRLALRECQGLEPGQGSASKSASSCTRGRNGKSCEGHSRKIRDMYIEKLEALGCICRALIALGQESCCNPRRRSAGASVRSRSNKAASSRSRRSIDSFCASGADANCCSSKKPAATYGKCKDTGDGPVKVKASSISTSCADSCCAGNEPGVSAGQSTKVLSDMAREVDVEKTAFSHDEKGHVILSISGMTCTGCETKLVRSLGTLPSVKNLKTSLVLARAEFDLVGRAVSVVEVIKHLERTTEFKCERISNQGSSLDIVVPAGGAAAFVNQPWPYGVTEMKVVDERTVNISYNADLIGARDLIESDWGGSPIHLAANRLDPSLETGKRHVRHIGYMTLLSAGLTIPVLVMAWAHLPEHDLAYSSASLALATLVQFIVAGPFYPKALKALVFSRVIEMDLLIVLSTSAAYIFSVVSFAYLASGRPLSTGQFFETSTLLVTLIMVGRWVAALARQKAVESISMRSLQSPTAVILTDEGEKEIDARLLQYGDILKIAPDSRVPTDGTVISGSSEVDESMMTGESMLVEKHAKCSVIAGTVNGSGMLHVRLTRLPGDNTISTVASMVDEAKLSKPRIQAVADRVASYFVPAVVVITIAVFCIWIAVGMRVRGLPANEATIQAVTYAITVLIVSCPCAIGLAVPMVVVIASGVAAERGVVFKSAEGLEVAHKTSHVVFDKTGTITEGKLALMQEWYADGDQTIAKSLLLGLVGNIKHPVSAAIALHLKHQGVSPASISDAKALTGKGVEGVAGGSGLALKAGNSRWLCLESHPTAQSMLSRGYTVFGFTVGGSLAAIFGLQDSIRSDAGSTVQSLLDNGISVHILSGDDDGAVRSVATQLRIAEANVRSRCTPVDKQAYIQELLQPKTDGRNKVDKSKQPVVIFCGDGTNDAVALAQATIGIHMNEQGTEVAQSAADVVLMRPSLAGVLTVIAVSKKSMRRIMFNFGWSFVYNLFAVLLAAGAFVDARIPPEYAGLGELVSVLPVIAAATLLRWSRI
ncbi:heavy metal translocatin [Trichoderma citrinoviride]|uniref:Heavy metal translocatin n=1 Tax=Trichoderma citrinoviride TaxID=58853 RepID=A0A2T4BER1_9HYPO|nr:heavy metal translocatin [Trichoderma citrinoviride]PTB67796.1 heavy metal translocatin [Trichoderma citrinoviride]